MMIFYKWSSENRFFSTKQSLGSKFRDYGPFWQVVDYQYIAHFSVFRPYFLADLASPLQCNRDAVTVQSRRRYGEMASRLHRNGDAIWLLSRKNVVKKPPTVLPGPVFPL